MGCFCSFSQWNYIKLTLLLKNTNLVILIAFLWIAGGAPSSVKGRVGGLQSKGTVQFVGKFMTSRRLCIYFR